ncbi:MAG TPA: hypothetical protein VFC78_02195 [Tepidisphaeraceae bacterium]|nr:hypothetical protein [Tepidisphaeraceae bacterium]
MKYFVLLAAALLTVGCDKKIHEAYVPAPKPLAAAVVGYVQHSVVE